MQDPYNTLGVKRGASGEDVEKAYKKAIDLLDAQRDSIEDQREELTQAYRLIVGYSNKNTEDHFSDEGEPSWARPWPVIFQTVIAIVLGAVAGLLFVLISGIDIETPSSGELFIPQLFTGLAFLLVPLWYVHRNQPSWKETLKDLGFRSFSPLKSLGWAILAFFIYLTFAGIYSSIFGETEQDLSLEALGSPWAQFFLIVILAPIAEEVCFRGMLFRGFLQKFSLPLAVIFQSAIFSALHVTTGVGAIPILFVLGALFALLYYQSKSLWVPIIAHVANNGLVFLAISVSA